MTTTEQRYGIVEGVGDDEIVIYDKTNGDAWLQVPEELVVKINDRD